MPRQKLSLEKAYSTQSLEAVIESPVITGNIPTWLNGHFISNGPAQFEVGNTHFKHWFDGFAMLKKFQFDNGKVQFQNRFLRSQQYVNSNANHHLYRNEFGTYARPTFAGKVLSCLQTLMNKDAYDDNCIVNTQCINERFIAMTETSNTIEFDIHDLQTLGPFQFSDKISGQMELPHPQCDISTQEMINITIDIGKSCRYHVYTVKPGTLEREIIHTYQSDKLFYMHSFSVTKNYVILFKSPLIINKIKVLLGLPFNDTLSWQEKEPTSFVIINRRNKTVHEVFVEPFFCFHSVNAFERGSELILDLICYENGNPYDSFIFANLKADQPKFLFSTLKRYIVDVKTSSYQMTALDDQLLEFPRINYQQFNGNDYRYCYTNLMTTNNQKFFNAIQKYHLHTNQKQVWQKEGYFLGEVVFVEKPESAIEDEGILLSIAFNAATECSALVLIDAQTMQQIAEVALPFHLPFGLHGNFYALKI